MRKHRANSRTGGQTGRRMYRWALAQLRGMRLLDYYSIARLGTRAHQPHGEVNTSPGSAGALSARVPTWGRWHVGGVGMPRRQEE